MKSVVRVVVRPTPVDVSLEDDEAIPPTLRDPTLSLPPTPAERETIVPPASGVRATGETVSAPIATNAPRARCRR